MLSPYINNASINSIMLQTVGNTWHKENLTSTNRTFIYNFLIKFDDEDMHAVIESNLLVTL